jgi:hypothetical protein
VKTWALTGLLALIPALAYSQTVTELRSLAAPESLDLSADGSERWY